MGETGFQLDDRRDDAIAVVRRLRESGHTAYFAGGCVRDMLLGLEPKDYDIATDAEPGRVRQLFSNTQAVGAAFGVILVRQRKSVIEVATFRTDLAYKDGRRPEGVVFTTAEEDAKRRDFTINGMFFDPIENKVIDYVGGQADLKNKLLRAIGEPNHRFEEDHLRLLRAIRFAARFGLAIESETLTAVHRHASELQRISPERVGEEVRLMLTPATRTSAYNGLRKLGLLQVIFRFVRRQQAGMVRVFDSLAPGKDIPFGLALAGALVSSRWQGRNDAANQELFSKTVAQQFCQAMRQALKISNEESEDLFGTLEGVGSLLNHDAPTVAQKKRFLARPTSSLSRALMHSVMMTNFRAERIATLLRELETLEKTEFAPPPLITGDDLTAAGLQPGPLFKRVLHQVYDAQLEDRVKTKQEAMEMAMKLASEI